MADTIVILDYGSQYNQLIARRVRELKVFSQVLPPSVSLNELVAIQPKGIILSGGPASVYQPLAPRAVQGLFDRGIPIMGICYGMQVMAHQLGGRVVKTKMREYGHARLIVDHRQDLFANFDHTIQCWMSHGDSVKRLPPGFLRLAHTKDTPVAAMGDPKRRLYGVQFHPEVAHTEHGLEILKNFVIRICQCHPSWTMRSFIQQQVEQIRQTVGDQRVVVGLSGGVDSSVTALLVHRAIGERLTGIFVNNGLLRKGEEAQVRSTFQRHFKIPIRSVDARQRFLDRLRWITDPEKKRRIIGNEFVRVFEEEARRIPRVAFLAQGTLYPDVIESRSAFGGPSATIKTHHNVGGLPERMGLKLIEPLRLLFKDEVRQVGHRLGLPEELIVRHPFPGPGLAVRILGQVTEQRLGLLREADARFIEELKASGWYRKIWQAFCVLLPVRSVGVMGDERTYEYTVAVRAVTSVDGMTADWAKLPSPLLQRIANRIINEVRGINRVVYDISSKPPATIEWE